MWKIGPEWQAQQAKNTSASTMNCGEHRARRTLLCGVACPTFASASLPHLVSVRVCEPADGVAEVSVAFRRAERVRALAFRIQGVDGRWRMTALQLC